MTSDRLTPYQQALEELVHKTVDYAQAISKRVDTLQELVNLYGKEMDELREMNRVLANRIIKLESKIEDYELIAQAKE